MMQELSTLDPDFAPKVIPASAFQKLVPGVKQVRYVASRPSDKFEQIGQDVTIYRKNGTLLDSHEVGAVEHTKRTVKFKFNEKEYTIHFQKKDEGKWGAPWDLNSENLSALNELNIAVNPVRDATLDAIAKNYKQNKFTYNTPSELQAQMANYRFTTEGEEDFLEGARNAFNGDTSGREFGGSFATTMNILEYSV